MGAAVRVVGPRTAVESAKVLLKVILEYMDKEREMQESGAVVRQRLQVGVIACSLAFATMGIYLLHTGRIAVDRCCFRPGEHCFRVVQANSFFPSSLAFVFRRR